MGRPRRAEIGRMDPVDPGSFEPRQEADPRNRVRTNSGTAARRHAAQRTATQIRTAACIGRLKLKMLPSGSAARTSIVPP